MSGGSSSDALTGSAVLGWKEKEAEKFCSEQLQTSSCMRMLLLNLISQWLTFTPNYMWVSLANKNLLLELY